MIEKRGISLRMNVNKVVSAMLYYSFGNYSPISTVKVTFKTF